MVFACKIVTFGPDLQVSVGPRHDLSFCACTTACLASELLVSMGLNLHLWFFMQNSYFWNRITSLHGYLTSPFVLCMQNSMISTRNTSLYGFQPSSVVLCIQNSDLRTKIACVYGSHTSPMIFCIKKQRS